MYGYYCDRRTGALCWGRIRNTGSFDGYIGRRYVCAYNPWR